MAGTDEDTIRPCETTHLITADKRDLYGRSDSLQNGSPLYGDSWRQSKDETNEMELFSLSVKLDPGWVNPAGPTTTQQSSITQDIEELMNNPPKDRLNLVYIIMMVHGIAVLIPWNMFINAKDYFENYKLDAGNKSSAALLDYKTNFMSYIGMAAQYPCFLMHFINLFVQCKGNTLGLRILTSIIINVVMFAVVVILAIIDTSSWPELFFWITVVTAIVINAAAGIYQNSAFGIAAILPMKYTNAVIFGQNISGTLVSVTNIIVLVPVFILCTLYYTRKLLIAFIRALTLYFRVSPSKRTAAIYYFVVAIIILLMAFGVYFLTFRCKLYSHYQRVNKLKNEEYQEKMDKSKHSYKVTLNSFVRVFLQIYHLLFGVWLTLFVTLALFPAVMSDVKPLTVQLSEEYWTAIFCFLCFNLFATFGNLTTEFIKWPNARWINVIVILRLCFVPLMILGNFRPTLRTLPVYIPHDSVFIISAILFSFSFGYCCSLSMMYAPKYVAPNDSSTAGMMMAIFLVFGVVCGVNISRVWGIVVGSG